MMHIHNHCLRIHLHNSRPNTFQQKDSLNGNFKIHVVAA